MSLSEDQEVVQEALRKVDVQRLSTGPLAESAVHEQCQVVVERPVTIEIGGETAYTVLCTPTDIKPMVLGFLLSEGIIRGKHDVIGIEECEHDSGIVRVQLAEGAPGPAERGRNLVIVSACGMCGSEGVGQMLATVAAVGSSLRVDRSVLRTVRQAVSRNQPLFKESGGTHAAGIFDAAGGLITCAEDIGRHNALDKAIGKCLIERGSATGYGAALSGRVSLEMVVKCARAGIELITAVSAPTSLAVDAAARWNITLCAFVRETRATVFTCGSRVTEALSEEVEPR